MTSRLCRRPLPSYLNYKKGPALHSSLTHAQGSALLTQDRKAASQSAHSLAGHSAAMLHGICAVRHRLPPGSSGSVAPHTHSLCQLRSASDEEPDDGQRAFMPPGQVQCSGQCEDVLMVRICSCWGVSPAQPCSGPSSGFCALLFTSACRSFTLVCPIR